MSAHLNVRCHRARPQEKTPETRLKIMILLMEEILHVLPPRVLQICCCFNVVRLANTGSWVCLAYWALGFGDSLTKNMKIDGANELEMMMMMMMIMMMMIFPTTW